MRRIGLAIIFIVGVALAPSVVAQHGGKIPRIGILSMYSPEDRTYIWALREGLSPLRHKESVSLVVAAPEYDAASP
jgi:hypothetical protein